MERSGRSSPLHNPQLDHPICERTDGLGANHFAHVDAGPDRCVFGLTWDRLKPLMNSHLIVRLEEEGTWQVSTQGSSVRYDCLACTDDVSAELEVVQGRCLATEKTGWRADLLTGFHSIHEIDGKSVTEIVFFYNNRNWGASRGPEIN